MKGEIENVEFGIGRSNQDFLIIETELLEVGNARRPIDMAVVKRLIVMLKRLKDAV